jgi:hypothetical protein
MPRHNILIVQASLDGADVVPGFHLALNLLFEGEPNAEPAATVPLQSHVN